MFESKMSGVIKSAALAVLAVAMLTGLATAQTQDRLKIAVGRALVVQTTDEVRTVAIAEPKIADAAVGSAKSVVVNGRAPGITSLVVYSEGGRYKVYEVEVFTPNAEQQVLLHVRVAELNESAKKELGFDFFGQGTSSKPWLDGFLQGGILTSKISPMQGDPLTMTVGPKTDGFLNYIHNGNNWQLQTAWNALEEKGDLHTLASPTLVARSGEPASFLAGGEFPIPVASSSGTGGQTTVTIEWKEFGIKVNFTPTVLEDKSISLKVAPEVSQIDFSQPLQVSGFNVPVLVTRKTSTTVQMKTGEHLVVGGLNQTEKVKNVRRVPVLGQIPLLGFFFTHTTTSNVTRELIVVVSPEVIEPSAGAMPELTSPEAGKK